MPQNAGLSREAKLARSYRDEMDEYKEEAEKVDRYERELTKYREKMREMDFYKNRVEVLFIILYIHYAPAVNELVRAW